MNKLIEQLNVVERKRWNQLRKQIASRKDDMWEWIEWVMEVRVNKLFREEYSSFESYASADLGWSSRYANYMIEACETRQQLGTIVLTIPPASQITNEAQLRELSGVSEDKLPEVVAVAAAIAAEEDKPISAKILRKARQQVSPKPKTKSNGKDKSKKPPEPDREPGDDTESDPYLTFEQQIAESEKQLRTVRTLITNTETALKAIVKCERGVEPVPGLEKICSNSRNILRLLDEAKLQLISSTPHGVCSKCKGAPLKLKDGCAKCGNHGWLNSAGSMAVSDKDLENAR